jgi:hypothetical protein
MDYIDAGGNARLMLEERNERVQFFAVCPQALEF